MRRLAEGPAGSLIPPDHDPALLAWYDQLEAKARRNDSAEMDRILQPLLREVLGFPEPAPET